MAALSRRLSNVRRRLNTLEEKFERLVDYLYGILSTLEEMSGRVRPRRLRPVPRDGVPPSVVVEKVIKERLADGSLRVQLDAWDPVVLPPKLGELLLLLATDNGQSCDGLVGWWTVLEVAERLRGKGYRAWQVRKGNVNQLVWRLRSALERAGCPRGVIQTSRRRGVRLALRRAGASPLLSVGPVAAPGAQSSDGRGGGSGL